MFYMCYGHEHIFFIMAQVLTAGPLSDLQVRTSDPERLSDEPKSTQLCLLGTTRNQQQPCPLRAAGLCVTQALSKEWWRERCGAGGGWQ